LAKNSAFTFWQAETSKWPILAPSALDVVSLPASQAATETVCSVCGGISRKGKRIEHRQHKNEQFFCALMARNFLCDVTVYISIIWCVLMVLLDSYCFFVLCTSGLQMQPDLIHSALCFWLVLKLTHSYYSSSYSQPTYVLVCIWHNID